jgi:hypothetical protein
MTFEMPWKDEKTEDRRQKKNINHENTSRFEDRSAPVKYPSDLTGQA